MKKRFTEEQIVAILQEQQNSGKTVVEIARKNGISENTFYIWKRKYGNMTVSEVTRLRELEDENAKLKRLVAELSLESMVQKDVIKTSAARSEAYSNRACTKTFRAFRKKSLQGPCSSKNDCKIQKQAKR